jgi:hypothetical protein
MQQIAAGKIDDSITSVLKEAAAKITKRLA